MLLLIYLVLVMVNYHLIDQRIFVKFLLKNLYLLWNIVKREVKLDDFFILIPV